MKKYQVFFLAAFFSVVGLAVQDSIQIPVEFPVLQSARSANEMKLSMDGLLNTMQGGLPSVPVRTLKIAVPEGKKFHIASWTSGEKSRTRLNAHAALASAQVPMSWMQNPPKNLPKGSAPSFRGEMFPSVPYEISEQTLHGVKVLIVSIYPVQVGKDLRSLTVAHKGTLDIQFEDGEKSDTKLFEHQMAEVEKFVDNKEVLDTYRKNGVRGRAAYDYLIISTSNYIGFTGENDLSKFAASLQNAGLKSKIVDMANINNIATTGVDLPEKIHNFIKQEYTESGIRYVLLAGESRTNQPNFIPTRKLWSKIMAYFGGGMPWTPVELDIPSDTYYSNLDGEFNSNGNAHWGEANDGANGTDVDFLSEVKVGRVALRNTTDLQNFVKKSLRARAEGISKTAALLGEMLFKEKDLYGDEYMDQLIGSVEEHGYKTTGYDNTWKHVKLYDRVSTWSGTVAQSQINKADVGMVNHLGHSNNSTNMRLSTSNISSFANVKPFVYYTQGCYAAGFDTGSFVDRMEAATNAAVVAIGNTVYGLAPEDPQPTLTKTPGASQMLHRVFIHNLMAVPKVSMGEAHAASKEFFIGLKSAEEVRWVTWTATFFGDPSLTLGQ